MASIDIHGSLGLAWSRCCESVQLQEVVGSQVLGELRSYISVDSQETKTYIVVAKGSIGIFVLSSIMCSFVGRA